MTYSHKSPMHKLLASAGAVSIVAASFAAVPASFAAENPPAAAAENNGPCRHVAATATSYQGLPGEYQLAYSNGNLYTTFANGRLRPGLRFGLRWRDRLRLEDPRGYQEDCVHQ